MKILIVPAAGVREGGLVFPGELQVVGYQEVVRLLGESADTIEYMRKERVRAEEREAALREDLEMFVKAQLGISIPEPGESFVQTTLRLYRMSKRRAAEFGIPEGENLDVSINNFEEYDALQQRLTVADQREGELEALLLESNELLYVIQDGLGGNLWSAVDVLRGKVFTALKPAEEGDGREA